MNLSSGAKLAVTEPFACRSTVPMGEAIKRSFTFTLTQIVRLIEDTLSGAIVIVYQVSVAPEGESVRHLVSANESDVNSSGLIDLSKPERSDVV